MLHVIHTTDNVQQHFFKETETLTCFQYIESSVVEEEIAYKVSK